jgi:hypothetical protein
VRIDTQDRADPEPQTAESNQFSTMTEAELLTAFEICRIGCGIHEGKLPREWTMRKFWQIWCELRLREQKRLRGDLARRNEL